MNWLTANWPAPQHVKTVSTTRHDGQSAGGYSSLNLGQHVGDDPDLVSQNRRLLQSESEMPSAPYWLDQIHSTRVVEASKTPKTLPVKADASFSTEPGVVCTVMTADCLPLLVTNSKGTQVASIHAGWRGLVDGIIENTLNKFSDDVLVWLGPAIGPNAFEVGPEVRQAFIDKQAISEQAFVARQTLEKGSSETKYLADIYQLARFRLRELGADRIYGGEYCTFSNPDFFSYRRDGQTGRQASSIWIAD